MLANEKITLNIDDLTDYDLFDSKYYNNYLDMLIYQYFHEGIDEKVILNELVNFKDHFINNVEAARLLNIDNLNIYVIDSIFLKCIKFYKNLKDLEYEYINPTPINVFEELTLDHVIFLLIYVSEGDLFSTKNIISTKQKNFLDNLLNKYQNNNELYLSVTEKQKLDKILQQFRSSDSYEFYKQEFCEG